MTSFIILTAEQAAEVRGLSETIAAFGLNPVERVGDVFILNVAVLNDPVHAAHRDYLAALPTIDISDPSFPAELALPE